MELDLIDLRKTQKDNLSLESLFFISQKIQIPKIVISLSMFWDQEGTQTRKEISTLTLLELLVNVGASDSEIDCNSSIKAIQIDNTFDPETDYSVVLSNHEYNPENPSDINEIVILKFKIQIGGGSTENIFFRRCELLTRGLQVKIEEEQLSVLEKAFAVLSA